MLVRVPLGPNNRGGGLPLVGSGGANQGTRSRYVSLTVGPAQTHASSIDAFGAGESVGGVGQDGRWWALLRTLSVVDGDRAFQVILTLDEPAASQELALGIARSVLENLPAR